MTQGQGRSLGPSELAPTTEDPVALLTRLARSHDVVLLGERHGVDQVLRFVTDHVGAFAAAGFTAIGMEFGAAELQPALDAALEAPSFDAARVRAFMFAYNVGWALTGYQDIAKGVWAYNNSRPARSQAFRLLNLSYIFDWAGFAGVRSPDAMARVQFRGPIDVFRADVIEAEVAAGGKVLALMGEPHALRSDLAPFEVAEVAGYKHRRRGWTAQVLADRHPGRVASVLMHGVVPAGARFVPPADGIIDDLTREVGPIAFDLSGASGDLRIGGDFGSTTLREAADGYIALAPIEQLRGTPIDVEFATSSNWTQVLDHWPDVDWHPRPVSLNDYYARITRAYDYPRAWGIS